MKLRCYYRDLTSLNKKQQVKGNKKKHHLHKINRKNKTRQVKHPNPNLKKFHKPSRELLLKRIPKYAKKLLSVKIIMQCLELKKIVVKLN